MLSRFLKSRSKDPLWDHFVNSPPADAANDTVPHLQSAPEGRIYPVKEEVTDPANMSQNIKELAQWLGADLVGIGRIGSSQDPTAEPAAPEDGTEEDSEGPVSSGRSFPFAIVCTIAAEYDHREAKGLGGQQAVQKGAVVNLYLRAYIRELGYRASFGGPDSMALAEATGLGRLHESGRFAGRGSSPYTYVAEVITTDLPLAPDATID